LHYYQLAKTKVEKTTNELLKIRSLFFLMGELDIGFPRISKRPRNFPRAFQRAWEYLDCFTCQIHCYSLCNSAGLCLPICLHSTFYNFVSSPNLFFFRPRHTAKQRYFLFPLYEPNVIVYESVRQEIKHLPTSYHSCCFQLLLRNKWRQKATEGKEIYSSRGSSRKGLKRKPNPSPPPRLIQPLMINPKLCVAQIAHPHVIFMIAAC
jgi:hypothetical protein